MTTLVDGSFPTLVNWGKRIDPDGSIARITNVLAKKIAMLEHMPWEQGNLPTGHRITQTSNALPSGSFRKYNAGISPTKGDTDQYDESCCMLEDESIVDVDLAELNGNAAAFRSSEDDIKVAGLGEQFETSLLYESVTTNPERMHGFAPRYPATSGYTSSGYVLRGGGAAQSGGTADNRSIWLIDWQPRKVYGIFPKGSKLGLQKDDLSRGGPLRVADPNDSTKFLRAWVTHFQWKFGLAIEDYRYVVRIQWDPSDTTTFSATSKALIETMQDALEIIHDRNGNLHWYMDRTSKRRFNKELLIAGESRMFTALDEGRKIQENFMGVPIHVTDCLVSESYIS